MRIKLPFFSKKSFGSGQVFYPYINFDSVGNLITSSSNIDTGTVQGQANAFIQCAPLSGIILRKCTALAAGKLWYLDEEDNQVLTAQTKKLKALLKKPNPLQTWSIFLQQAYAFYQIFGEVFIYALMPEGMETKDRIKALYIIPNLNIRPNFTGVYLNQFTYDQIIKDYTLSNGETLKNNEILHIRSIVPNMTGYAIQSQSVLASLQDPINNIIAAYKKRNIIIDWPVGIMSNEAKDMSGLIPIDAKEKKSLETNFNNHSIRNRKQIIFANAALRWSTMLPNVKELMLFEEIEDDISRLCDALNYPKALLAFTKGTTFNNMAEANKALYQNAIIPDANMLMEYFTNYLETEKYNPPTRLGLYYEHVEALQQSEAEKATAKKANVEAAKAAYESGLISFEEARAWIDMDEQVTGELKPAQNENSGNN